MTGICIFGLLHTFGAMAAYTNFPYPVYLCCCCSFVTKGW